ncbi:hypothetical protein [Blastomonas sp.]|uniref:hypothetical protein n=1 Tax=Blastomonas sp. TaxID=1909299 RepID=UPI00181C8C06|nr:type II restriction endonuclease [Blastomonas sp.]
MEFVQRIAESRNVPTDHLVVQYLERKTKAVDRGSKARRSLGNLYALYVVAEDYLAGRQSRFTDLLSRMRAMPFGSKLQNHPLDNRLNDEFARSMGVDGELLPIKAGLVQGAKSRSISQNLLTHGGSDPTAVASLIVEVIDTYVSLITEKQAGALEEIEAIAGLADLRAFFEEAFAAKADARLFEVSSYVLLAEHYRHQKLWMGTAEDQITEHALKLFKTGRTNANDGGIDFVLKPAGRFFQVTETLDFGKYFLDLDKVNRFPITFVVKTELSPSEALTKIKADAVKSGKFAQKDIEIYISLFEEIITLTKLRALLENVPAANYASIKAELTLQFQLEYGLLD